MGFQVFGGRDIETDLLGTIQAFIRLLFGAESQGRFGAHHFPFTEPGIETDLSCTVCHRRGCRLCRDSGRVEIIPGGMVPPVVLRNGGIDPTQHSGCAYGAGVDRIAVLWSRISDIRTLYDNDLRLLEQF
jgi:phenylalanyl-tRNA synthetase alpha chain